MATYLDFFMLIWRDWCLDIDDGVTFLGTNDIKEDEPESEWIEVEAKEPKLFTIRFEVPYGDELWEVEIMPNSAFVDVFADIATAMDQNVAFLYIGYIFSFIPKSSKPCPIALENESNWKKLVMNAATHVAAEKEKSHGKGVVRPWMICINVLTDDIIPEESSSRKVHYSSLTIH